MEKNKEFYNWLFENIEYHNQLTQEEINQLKELYDIRQNASKIWENVLESSFRNSGIDYENDAEKARNRYGVAIDNLDEFKNYLDNKYNNDKSEQISAGRGR